MDTFDKVVKAAEKLDLFSNDLFASRSALTPLAVLWAGYTVAEAIKEASQPEIETLGSLENPLTLDDLKVL
ncbi:hypothetical protein E4U03_11715 [Rothia nasimurium]|uniref:Uncharacterized protein n=1 Tax=Rothia nasimurium TaxID=85336 RepID=A0A4Y9F1A0_9MICC|nr:hypothetical protein [Rothia nasimurium]MBF0809265.1 hypothetical protein [Rothia nasimurium]TFU20216.1 hypothetical protein E4U03_11715 [Rothia nasimurium]